MSFVRNFRRGVLVAAAALFAGSFATSASAQMELKIIAPAAPGGGWDQTARSMQQALIAEKLVKNAQVINIAGAGGTIGLAQFVNGAKGDGNQLMVNGFVMVGAILLNKSPVSMSQITPIARITEETQVMVVPANSPIKDAKDLAEAVKKDVAKVTFAGGSAGGVDHIMAALFVGAILSSWLGQVAGVYGDESPAFGWALVYAAALTLPLAVRRRHPEAVLLFVAGFVVLCVALAIIGSGAFQRTRATVAARTLAPIDLVRQRRVRRLLIVAGVLVAVSFAVSLLGSLF